MASEVPVALTYNKRSHVVMMVTPDALEDFAIGFSLTEGIIKQASDIQNISVLAREKGLELAVTVSEDCFANLEIQRRNLVGRTGCGLCGAESLDQAIHNPAVVTSRVCVTASALQAAILSLNEYQPLQVVTGAVHGAAWCSLEGEILVLREDVGRHNALDKAIGKLFLEQKLHEASLIILSSRISYELVQKAGRARIPAILAISRPTSLAVELAEKLNISVACLARRGGLYIYCGEHRFEG